MGLTRLIYHIIMSGVMTRYIDTGCTYEEVYVKSDKLGMKHYYRFTGPCRVTGEEYSVTVKGPELFRMRQTNSIMALKSLDSGDREFLISGTSPKGWDKLFS